MARHHVLAAASVLAVGCVDSGGSTSDAGVRPFPSIVNWKLQNTAGQVQPCPAGFDTAEVILMDGRGAGSLTPFPCADGTGVMTVSPPPRGSWGVKVRITNGPGGQVFGESLPVLFQSGVTLRVITDEGRLKVHWTLSQGGVTRTCSELGIEEVQIEVTPAQGQPMAQSATCLLREATTGSLPTGTARVVVTAGAVSGALDNVVVPTGSLTVDVPPIDLAF